MLRKRLIPAVIFAFALSVSAAYAGYEPDLPKATVPPTAAPVPVLTRAVLQTVEYPGEQYKTIEVSGVLAPYALAGWHTHPGYEIGYCLDGEAILMVKGQPNRHLKAGDSWATPPDTPHAVQNLTGTPFKFVSTYIVDKSKPLATAVQTQ